MFDDYIAILDIGTTKIVAMVGRKDPSGHLHILGYGEETSLGVNRGLVMNMNEAGEVIERVVKKARDESGINFKEVFVGIAGQNIYSNTISHSIYNKELDEITSELVEKIINEVYNMSIQSGEKILHVFPQSYMVDNQPVKNPAGTMGKQLSGAFHVSIGTEKAINVLQKTIERVGLKIIKIILEPVASAEAVLTPEEKEAGVVMLDIGGGTTDMIIVKDNNIRYTAVIPFGGNSITNDIKEGCNILEKQAETLKLTYGSAIADMVSEDKFIIIEGIAGREEREIAFKTVAEIIQARIIEIIDNVKNQLKNSGFIDKVAAGITITGGGSQLKYLSRLIEYRIGLETKIAFPDKYIYNNNSSFSNPKYATAIGLLLKGIDYMNQISKQKQKLKAQTVVQPEETKKIEDTETINENKTTKPENKEVSKENGEAKNKGKVNNIFQKIFNYFADNEDDSQKV